VVWYEWFGPWEARSTRRLKTVSVSASANKWASDRVDFFDVGSPLSNKYYIPAPRREIYGIDHHVDRFSLQTAVKLGPDTSIPGLYVTGQDILSCGFAGAMFSGMITA